VAGRFIPGLLFGNLKEQPGANPEMTARLRDMLSNIADGQDPVIITPGLRAILSPAARTNAAARLKELKSFTFLDCDDRRGLERQGSEVSRACYYKMVTGSQTIYYVFWLTGDGRVADLTSIIE
jgi:hypothetical protein